MIALAMLSMSAALRKGNNMTTMQTIKAIWASQPTSEKVGGIISVFVFPVLFWALWVMLP